MKKEKLLYIVAAMLVVLLAISLLLGDEQTAAKIPAMLVSVAVGLVLVLGIIVAAYIFSNRHKNQEEAFRAAAVAVQGKVIRIDHTSLVRTRSSVYGAGGEMHILHAEYEYEGQCYTDAKRSYFGEPPYKVGDAITVFVDPKSPSVCKILNDDHPVQESL